MTPPLEHSPLLQEELIMLEDRCKFLVNHSDKNRDPEKCKYHKNYGVCKYFPLTTENLNSYFSKFGIPVDDGDDEYNKYFYFNKEDYQKFSVYLKLKGII